jgi:mRNA interferase HicA
MKRERFMRHLAEHGCVEMREGGRHTMVANPSTGQMQAVPRHREIKGGLLQKICRGLSVPPPNER